MFDAKDWHRRVKALFESSPGYQRYAEKAPYGGRLIPLCTPVMNHPPSLVIGANHSDFAPKDLGQSERIAQAYADGVPQENTFIAHDHRFAQGLHRVCGKSGITIDGNWVGTNRCPIQTGPNGIGDFNKTEWFQSLLPQMDALLDELIWSIAPRNVLLCGEFAKDSVFKGKVPITQAKPRPIVRRGVKIQFIPICHPSRGTHDDISMRRLQESFRH